MKEAGPVICRRKSTYKTTQAGKPGPTCGRCDAAVVSRSDLVGWLEDAPLCLDCLTAEAPALGWALQLVEVAALALAGRWPRKAQNRELPILLELVRGTRAAAPPAAEPPARWAPFETTSPRCSAATAPTTRDWGLLLRVCEERMEGVTGEARARLEEIRGKLAGALRLDEEAEAARYQRKLDELRRRRGATVAEGTQRGTGEEAQT